MYIRAENKNQIGILASLARKIWRHHFGPMMEAGILDDVIEKVQSEEAISKQIEEGYQYYILQSEGTPVGYFAYRISIPENELFLSKLYILATERRKGRGKQVLKHLEGICRSHHIDKLRLTVHHQNTSAIEVYEKNDFRPSVGLPEISAMALLQMILKWKRGSDM